MTRHLLATAVAVAVAQGTSIAGGAAVSGVAGTEDSQRLYRVTVPGGDGYATTRTDQRAIFYS